MGEAMSLSTMKGEGTLRRKFLEVGLLVEDKQGILSIGWRGGEFDLLLVSWHISSKMREHLGISDTATQASDAIGGDRTKAHHRVMTSLGIRVEGV